MKRKHNMPFGAEVLGSGEVRFRLWAPQARNVDVCLSPRPQEFLPTNSVRSGWYELVTNRARAGSLYKFRIDGGSSVPDPASRFQPEDVHGPSEVIDPEGFSWQDHDWRGLSWEQAVIYELHVGTFSPQGSFAGVEARLDYLRELGITAIEIMPVADFPGRRNWGYDGVLPFAPDSSYGRPDDLRHLVQTAHQKGLMVLLDVVYNHFGPEGNYLRAYAPQFFTDRYHTPWGDGINFDGPDSRPVREFFIHNALYWLTEFHIDGLRLDAVHAIADDSRPDILTEIAESIRRRIGAERNIHLVLENDKNAARYLQRNESRQPRLYDAQWNDDIHHALHVIVTGEKDGYYSDYADCPVQHLGRCLAEGFDFQGQGSAYRDGERRGECSRGLPPTAFVSFLQNHDQIGNRAFGERVSKLADARALKAAMSIILLSPQPPLLFMGEEFGAETPFLFFCDFGPDLAKKVTEGRRNEFSRFQRFREPSVRERIPDPSADSTFQASKIDWACLPQPRHREWLQYYRLLLDIRRRRIVPMISAIEAERTTATTIADRGLRVTWAAGAAGSLTVIANLGPAAMPDFLLPLGELLYSTEERSSGGGTMPGWSVTWYLEK